MAYRVTMIKLAWGGPSEGTHASFEVASEIEAARIAQEGAMIAKRKGYSVTYEVHDDDERLVLSYTSARTDP